MPQLDCPKCSQTGKANWELCDEVEFWDYCDCRYGQALKPAKPPAHPLTNPLTNPLNRRAIDEVAKPELKRHARYNSP